MCIRDSATGAYHVPAADIDAYAVYTNNIPCGAMRGFGVNQAIYGLECCIDELCEKGGFDRWQFRFDNALQNGDVTSTGQIIEGGAGVRETLLALSLIHIFSVTPCSASQSQQNASTSITG